VPFVEDFIFFLVDEGVLINCIHRRAYRYVVLRCAGEFCRVLKRQTEGFLELNES